MASAACLMFVNFYVRILDNKTHLKHHSIMQNGTNPRYCTVINLHNHTVMGAITSKYVYSDTGNLIYPLCTLFFRYDVGLRL